MKTQDRSGSGPSQRMLRVGELVRHALADALQRGDHLDPALAGTIITVPEVRMSPDLKIATCFVMPLGGKDVNTVIKLLAANQKLLRTEVARRVELKSVPSLRFLRDTSFDEGARIDALLRRPDVARDLDTETDAEAGSETTKEED
ncbi:MULTISPECIES: 30S ribosome-binding factor RbfA [Azorhizobium]|jgi:ribosome-binding factor A|uniref:Ribosome-binding factor A n=1 Tax=Azorhizobium caulinodans (strain ATCC 43989 / DSM 5975 / JCM 20966 / LMG 6465 / NBRC 14845 / NCIMB 13405 / ORS 571) TaxID=438753 RepID=RBFA_AZOC5|nr:MULTISPECIES: 30S ribosome-binding factor RbfA [Azorhizobium]A8IG22.1 RecName: Full=Ribosome-binding factor A [Azorhizobium caulinodans ORS 571]TDT91452.1 ribosome-binding factor A [Azorhizobium sp. AG788]BAF86019.1 ribosome-binding factor A [Azorhizobium caulinodans ORS 571]